MGLYCDIIRLNNEKSDECFRLKEDPSALYAFIQNTDPDNWFELDKAWHGIHFILGLLSNSHEITFLLNSGTVLRDYNWKEIYGISVTDMRAFSAEETLMIHNVISGITDNDFRKTYDPKLLIRNNVYPHIWKSSRVFEFFGKRSKEDQFAHDFLTSNFIKLKSFILETTEKKTGIIIKYHQ